MVLIGLAVLSVLVCAQTGEKGGVRFKVINMPPEFSTITERRVIVVRTDTDWKDYWQKNVNANVEDNGHWKPMPVVPVDFKTSEVIAIHLGTYPDTRQTFTVDSVSRSRDGYTVRLASHMMRMAMHHSSHPALLVEIPQSRARVSVMLDGEFIGGAKSD